MKYTDAQIGPIDIRPMTPRTKPGKVAIVVVHPNGEQVTVMQPVAAGTQRGRQRTLELLAQGISLDNIRACLIPTTRRIGTDEATDGLPLSDIRAALFWTSYDDQACGDMDHADYARRLLREG